MKNLIFPLLAFFLSSCAVNPSTHPAAAQYYRAKGADNQIKVQAALIHDKQLISDDYAVIFQINDKNALFYQLDPSANGEFSCKENINEKKGEKVVTFCEPHNGKKIGATCNGSTSNRAVYRVNCTFFYDNEIAANFTIQ